MYEKIKKVYDIYLKRRGTIGKSIYAFLIRRSFYLAESNVMKKQEVSLNIMLNYAKKHVPFYSKVLVDVDSKLLTLEKFPIVDKHIITEQFNDFISDVSSKYYHMNMYTGGSTGEPFRFLGGDEGFEGGIDLKRWRFLGYKRGDRILDMSGNARTEEEIKQGVWGKIHNPPMEIPFGGADMSVLYLNENNAKEYLDFIKEYSPQFLWGYPSFIYEIACYAESLSINLKGMLKAIVLTSEVALPYQIEIMKRVFDTIICLQYGHTESCVNAYTYDDTFRYRVEPLYGYVEVLDSNNEQVKEGEIGEVVVTSLHNHVMPLIRYRTGDFAEYGGRDSRYYYLNKVFGRTQDYIVGRNGQRIVLTALIFAQHFEAMAHINKWQIEQNEKGKVILRIVKGNSWGEKDKNEIVRLFDKIGNVDTEIKYVDDITRTSRGKVKMLIQHLEN